MRTGGRPCLTAFSMQVADQAAKQRRVAFDFDRLAALGEACDAGLEARRLLRGKQR